MTRHLECAERFRGSVTNLPAGGQRGHDYGASHLGRILGIEFNGTMADFASWENGVVAALGGQPVQTTLLFDVSRETGGYAENAELIAEEIRGAVTQTVGEADFPIAAWDQSDTRAWPRREIEAATPSCEEQGTMGTSGNRLVI